MKLLDWLMEASAEHKACSGHQPEKNYIAAGSHRAAWPEGEDGNGLTAGPSSAGANTVSDYGLEAYGMNALLNIVPVAGGAISALRLPKSTTRWICA